MDGVPLYVMVFFNANQGSYLGGEYSVEVGGNGGLWWGQQARALAEVRENPVCKCGCGWSRMGAVEKLWAQGHHVWWDRSAVLDQNQPK